ncbi:CHASE3 domain-containing protein [uncultured Brevundimonas sp.]|uniref:sensor histidine kinase n=1 Tax=uncultured Brevundimonas sp. TaxID=213418 RepID=UPI0026122B98|nr:CHASE3 domain-containing protein [uncultured Brevundimonas sp.]
MTTPSLLNPASWNFIRQSKPIYQRLMMLLAAAFVLLAITNIATFYMLHQTSEYTKAEVRSHQTQIAGWKLISLLTDAETGQRGFMLTANPEYLEVYNKALDNLPAVMAEMDRLVAGDPELESTYGNVKELYDDRIKLMVDTISLTRQGRVGEAVSAVRSGSGKAMMDGMREEIADISEVVERRAIEATNAAAQARAYTIFSSLVAGILIVILAAVCIRLVRRQITDLERAQGELDQINAGLEEQVRERTADLVRANEEVQRFAYIVSHDLRAPLVNVMGYTSELEEISRQVDGLIERVEASHPELVDEGVRLAIREDAPEAIGFIRASTSKMDRLIKAILQLSREGRRDLAAQSLDMKALLQNLADGMAHPLMENDGKVVIGDVPDIVHDRMAIEQIFGNLIDNAIKYRNPEQSLLLSINGSETVGGFVEFEVRDNGRGIDPKDHERVFELFRRSGRQDRPGEGVGLAFVRNTVRRLGGSISIESELGQGTAFIIRLPQEMSVRAS